MDHVATPSAHEENPPGLDAPVAKPVIDASQVDGIASGLFLSCVAVIVSLCLAIGLYVMLCGMTAFGPVQGVDKSPLLPGAEAVLLPERDMSVYAAGCAGIVALALAAIYGWRRILRRKPVAERTEWAVWTLGFLAAWTAACACLLVQHCPAIVAWLFQRHGLAPRKAWLLLLAPPCAVLFLVAKGLFLDGVRALRRFGVSVWDVLTPAMILLIVFIPDFPLVAGYIYRADAFIHTDFYFMAPTLAFRYGKALGLDSYSQYGLGWPLVLTALSPMAGISYSNCLAVMVVYACLYWCGLYLLLRRLTPSAEWAAAGILLAVNLQMFHGVTPGPSPIWQCPSSSVIRSCMDVWCFLALLLFARTARWRWAAVGAVAVGLALAFELDTGVYLVGAYGALLLGTCFLTRFRRAQGWRLYGTHLLKSSLAASAGVATLLLLLLIASRGHLLTPAFWRGWSEAVTAYGGGLCALPMGSVSGPTIVSFMVVAATMLGAVVWAAARLLITGKSEKSLLLGVIAFFGLALELLFVNRSHPYNLFHPIVPFCVVSVALSSMFIRRLQTALQSDGPRPWLRRGTQGLLAALPSIALLWVGVVLLLNPVEQQYPSLLNQWWNGSPSGNRIASSVPGIKLLGAPDDPQQRAMTAVVQWAKPLIGQGASIAFLDDKETAYYAALGVAPWYRYCPLFGNIYLRQQFETCARALIAHPPTYVLIRSVPPPNCTVQWSLFHQLLTKVFAPAGTVGEFEIWRPRK